MALVRRLTAATLSTFLAIATLTMLSSPAHAEDGFQYWGYYHLTDGGWEFATKGAGSITPDDGAVEGFHFAVSTVDQSRPPRVDTTFQEICGDTEAGQGQKRVGVVLDYGTAEEAPEGEQPPQPEGRCAVVADDFTTQQALQSVAKLRIEGGLICAIDGFPSTGCGEEVKNATIPASEPTVEMQLSSEDAETSSGGFPTALAGVAGVVVLLAGAGFLVSRRRAG